MNKLYERDSYLRENTTVITDCIEVGKEIFITLQETIFFPEEGGQYADTGKIEPIEEDMAKLKSDTNDVIGAAQFDIENYYVKILDGQLVEKVALKEKEYNSDNSVSIKDIYGNNHIVDKNDILYSVDKRIEKGKKVHCVLDYENRYDRMQNHSGEHILTGVIHNTYGYTNKGFHLGNDGAVTLDISDFMTYEEVINMEQKANEIIYANLSIMDSYPSEEELRNISYRSKMEIDGQVRLITIGTDDNIIDTCACCAPHVKRTGEVGIIKVTDVVKWKGGVRVSIVAGRRALLYINEEHNIIRELKDILSTSPENFPKLISSYVEELQEIKFKLNKQYEKNIMERIQTQVDSAGMKLQGAENYTPKQNYFEFVNADFPSASMKNIYNLLLEKFSGYVGIFAGDDETGYRYMAGGSIGSAKNISSALEKELVCKGGGSDKMVQGQIMGNREKILAILSKI